jgi:hypothetical protein
MQLNLRSKFALVALAAGVWLIGLGCSTPFKPVQVGLDYTVEPMDTNAFRITYHGDKGVADEQITDFALLRACDLARQQDASYFAVVNQAASTYDRIVFDTGTNALTLKPFSGLVVRCFTYKPRNVFVYKVTGIEGIMRRKYRPGDKWAKS